MANEFTIICGSPRSTGISSQAAEYLRQRLRDSFPESTINLLRICDLKVEPCIGCNQCRSFGKCFIHDDMEQVMDVLGRTDTLFVISPVYFAGPPAQFKALLDRLQPHYWLETRRKPKRAAYLMAVGEGGDPHGHSPLEICTRSALAVAGFKLLTVWECIGAGVRESVDAAFASIDSLADQQRLENLDDGAGIGALQAGQPSDGDSSEAR